MTKRYRLGLDLGVNSIGWCAVELDDENRPRGVLDAGVLILTPDERAGYDPQTNTSLAVDRRVARSARRLRDRYKRRQKRLISLLVEAGLMPADKAVRKELEKLNPYWLRCHALDEPLERYEIGRALFHLNQRRGFKSNRLADDDDADKSAMKQGIERLEEQFAKSGARTLGEFLHLRHRCDRLGYRLDEQGRRITGKTHEPVSLPQGVRFRPHIKGSKTHFDLYPTRKMVETELDAIWQAQKRYHDEMTDDLLARLKRAIIDQRPLKPQLVGHCTLRPEEKRAPRAPRALPIFQRFRILCDLANLDVTVIGRRARPLSIEERDRLKELFLKNSGLVKFKTIAKKLKYPEARFNLENGKRKGLDPDKTAAILGKTGKGESFGPRWRALKPDEQSEIVERLLGDEDEEELLNWLEEKYRLTHDQARAAAGANLPPGHGHLCSQVLEDLVEIMETASEETADPDSGEIYLRPLTYDEAVARLGLHHSHLAGEKHDRLPYYGKAMARHVIPRPNAPKGSQEYIGRVPNPTVHIGLNQARKLVNALIDAYGRPAQIHIELARELKLNAKQKKDIIDKNRENEKENDKRRNPLEALGVAVNKPNILKLRLYDELPPAERVCVYSGKPISCERLLFNGSVEIDHILPKSKTLDDGFNNKVLGFLVMNREKGNRAPDDVVQWGEEKRREIEERANRVFCENKAKAWRFSVGALESFKRDDDFLARHLTDTQHVSRLAQSYLGLLYGGEQNSRVFGIPGRLTAILRRRWGLNSLLSDHNRLPDDPEADGGEKSGRVKNRHDHRHHAIDAFVVACTDRRILQKVSHTAARAETQGLDSWAIRGEFPEPFAGCRQALRQALDRLVVSHKPNHGLPPYGMGKLGQTSGKLHDETAYGKVNETIDGTRYNLVSRKPITALTKGEIDRVRDVRLREALQHIVKKTIADISAYTTSKKEVQDKLKKKLPNELAKFGEAHGIRRVRLLKTVQKTIAVRHGDGRFKKRYVPGENHRIEIFDSGDGKWRGEGISVFDANRPDFKPEWRKQHPQARLVMRLHKGDLVQADFGDGEMIYKVVQLEPSADRVVLVRHYDAGNYDKRDKDKKDPFHWIRKRYNPLKQAGARPVRVSPIGRVYPRKG